MAGEISASTTWTLAGSPYVLDGSIYVRGASNPELTIEPGVEVRAGDGRVISIGDGAAGTLKAIGTAASPIVLTTTGAVSAGKW